MKNETALTVCPDYPPGNLEQLPFYDGAVATRAEGQAVYTNLWKVGDGLISGQMEIKPESMDCTVRSDRRELQAFARQPGYYPKCGFTMRLSGATEKSRQHLSIEMLKVTGGVDCNAYVRQKIELYDDGYASCESLRQGMSGKRLAEDDRLRQYEGTHRLTTAELRALDDLYVYIGEQQTPHRRARLAQYVGRRLRHCWYFLTG